MIKEAGSGHVGTSFSCLDIITWLWMQEMQSPNENKERADIYFSSKGHDAPALYSLLIGLEKLDESLLHQLRRLGGLSGHPDIHTPYIVTNTGSLGMGISKARGLALANRLNNKQGHIYVLSGDGELQEGQIWESLQPTANGKFSEITLIVDYNKIQSDTWVKNVSDLGLLEERFRTNGWAVRRCNGHNFVELQEVFEYFKTIKDRPQVLIADTVKGRGVSIMEKITVEENGEFYKFHSGAPDDEKYNIAITELKNKINNDLRALDLGEVKLESVAISQRPTLQNPERLVSAYGGELVKIAKENKDIVVLDADLMLDCGLGQFKKEFPDRFIECGIAEQDMVSVAGGLALKKKIPIAHSFACFLSTRPNEQIYNNATEKTKIIYTGSLAGLLPATPGHSHQSVRDISILGSVPGLVLIEPCNELETRQALRWAVNRKEGSTYIRLVSIPCEIPYKLPADYTLVEGRGIKLVEGTSAAIVGYGPVMLAEAVKASIILKKQGIDLAVFNLPWLNKIDSDWLYQETKEYRAVFTLDDHYVKLGQGSLINMALVQHSAFRKIISFGVEEIPQCGQNEEVLKYHGLDCQSLATKIKEVL